MRARVGGRREEEFDRWCVRLAMLTLQCWIAMSWFAPDCEAQWPTGSRWIESGGVGRSSLAPGEAEEEVASHKLAGTYAVHFFDGDFDPWHVGSVWGERKTTAAALIGRISYAYWFEQSDLQFEAEVYPFVSRTLYGYLNLGFSPTSESFPEWRLGAEAFVNLPGAWEVSGGTRYLAFESKEVAMLTGSLGKYYSAYWTSVRPYVAFEGGDLTWTVMLVTRRYLADPANYISFLIAYGDAPSLAINESELDRDSDFKVEVGARLPMGSGLTGGSTLFYEREELPFDRSRSRVGVRLVFERRF